ncbi:MAG: hypothetical protein COV99_02145 [Bacteroidetes bacterium CG12_big_fil_rev_8_21_14_0_65_60_17]|nr:MAG: hypothetical protein COV99_02145 [Bacteroidetes bacterium CG12_big_fil_rev_8_21_14_0_65_60_17]
MLVRTLRVILLTGILGLLAWQLTSVGWGEVLRNLPVHPLFYLFFLMLYVLLPIAESFIYRVTWEFDVVKAFPALIKKRIFNKDVVGYSGEVYFFDWARRQVTLPKRRIAETIRDNNIISSVASTVVSVVLLSVFLTVGELSLDRLVGRRMVMWLLLSGVVFVILIPVWIRFRRFLFSMEWRSAGIIMLIQVARLITGQMLQIGMWAVVMPDVPLTVWFTYAAVSIILSRIPFLPNQMLVFTSIGLGLSGPLSVAQAPLASMLVVAAGLDKILNLTLFGLITLTGRDRRAAEQPA